ncbi:hypothetical protein BaRGS_00032093 [Batillaria attramentaria]|uniref:Deacetylase sirtuin-type domain-containing protein n=1 Tax=Batillaria attramentaria TaxID=370345 RepID=A0ABD0JPP9_9CAEN
MVRRILIMAATSNSKGLAVRTDNLPLSKGGPGRRHRSGSDSKPPTGRPAGAVQSETTLVNGVRNIRLHDPRSPTSSVSSVNTSRSSPSPKLLGGRRPFSAERRPITIKNLPDVATLLRDQVVKNVVIVAGAGISTPSGIPDFRSPGTGLYDNLQQYSIPYPEAIFDIDFFHHNPRPFFTLAKELYPSGKYRPNYIHYFARLLHDRGMLLRVYTQNIDGLERIAGIPPEKMVEAHGTFSTATCVRCRQKYDGDEIKDKIFEDKLPRCKKFSCTGIVKPDIVFFGEELPKRFYYYLKDMLLTDLVLVMGTSLEVQPFAGIIDTVRFTVPRVLFNRMAVGPFRKQKRPKDFVSEGDLIGQMQEFVEMTGWTQDMVNLITRMEGYFRTAFPPPLPPSGKNGDKKASKVKPDPLAAMWRQNANINLYSDTDSDDSSDSDSQISRSDSDSSSSDSERAKTTGARGKGGNAGRGGGNSRPAGQRSGVSTVSSSSSSGCVSNASSSSGASSEKGSGGNNTGQRRGFATHTKVEKSGALLSRRNSDSSNGGGSHRSYSQNTVAKAPARNPNRAGVPPLMLADGRSRATGGVGVTPKPPVVSVGNRKPPAAANRQAHQPRRQQQQQPPGAHPIKPRSNSVNKAVPETVHSKMSQNLKNKIRIQSAQTARLAYRHRPTPPPPYDARMLCLNAPDSDSSSSDDDRDEDRDSDDSSDDSR